jgi:hypothetical protein
MKKRLMTMNLMFGLIFLSLAAHAEPAKKASAAADSAKVINPSETRACPNCSGDAPQITNVTFQPGETCTCTGSTSISVGPNVTVKNGATVTFQSPKISIINPVTFEVGSTINILWLTDPISISLVADPTSIAADGSSYSIITATFKDGNGDPVPEGTSVNFKTDLGTFPPNGQDYTLKTYDATGIVTVFLHAGINAGTATVTASLGSTSTQLQVTFYASGTASIAVKAVPSTLTADGSSTSTITATAKDGSGGAVADGTEITFTAEDGNFDGSKTTTATTVNGIATVTYTAPSAKPADGSDTISAEAPNGINGNTEISLTGPTIGTVVITADPTAIPANGTSTSTITATVTVEGGSAAPAGIIVTFTIKSGGGHFTADATTIQKATNDAGIAVVTLTSADTAGTATIGATADSVTAQDIEVIYQPGNLTLTIVPNSVLATGEEEAQVTILVEDADGNPVPNEQIDLSLSDATLGSFDNSQPMTDANGEATVVFTAGAKGGTVTVTATWNSGTDVTGTGTITIQPPPAFIEIADGFPDPQKINIRGTGGQGTSEVKFFVKDSQGNLVDAGYRIDFSIVTGPDGGENLIPMSTKTSDGTVGSLLYSGYKSGPVSIRATYHHDTSINTTTSQIVIVGGPAVGEEFGISAQYLNISGLKLAGIHDPITANAADRYGNAIADNTAIAFKTYNTGGFFETGTGLTSGGVASDDLVSGGTYLAPLNGFVSLTAEVVGGNTTRVSSIAVTPGNDTNIIYAGTNGGGVYKSMDSGATWQNISRSTENPKQGQNWIDPYVKGNSAICVDPDDHNTVYVGTGYLGRGHVYRSLDGGMNWNSNDIEQWNGIFSANAAVLTVLCDGDDTATNYPYVWLGTEGQGAWYSNDDGESFNRSNGLGYGMTVTEIVRVSDSHGASARLYAATPTGVFVSTDGGQNWSETAQKFTNDIINTLILHPTSNVLANEYRLYVGTENAGVLFSKDGGATDPWMPIPYNANGMGEGLSATVPVPDVNNEGNGNMSDVTVFSETQSEFWTVTYDGASGEFQVEGSVSGSQANAQVDQTYTISGVLSFTIYSGSVAFEDGDAFTFTTTRDPARTIKDLMVDPKNHRLYALTYFFGPLEPYHAVGNVYSISLDPTSDYEPTGSWVEANSGLPEYAPPRDTTLFPQYALATDNPSDGTTDPTWFLIGGEGINMYKAESGFVTGLPDWKVSKSGLSNTIMARMPLLFSGDCSMTVTEVKSPNISRNDGATNAGSGVFDSASASFLTEASVGDVLAIQSGGDIGEYTVSSVISDTSVILTGFAATATATGLSYSIINSLYNYTVYIQDVTGQDIPNGNPPISDSLFRVDTYTAGGAYISTVFNKTYADVLVDEGTFRDPQDAATDVPYRFSINFSGLVGEAKFTFTPNCDLPLPTVPPWSPGCSGSVQEQSFFH